MNRTAVICAVLVGLGLVALAGEFCHLRSRQQEREARLARAQASQEAADALLDGALSALRRRDPAEGLRQLAEYLDHEQASDRPRARQLLDDVRRATDGDVNAAWLRRLSEAQLARVESGEDLATFARQVTDPLVRPLLLDALRSLAPAERQRRLGLRQAEEARALRRQREREARVAWVRESAPYREMSALAADLRKRYHAERDRMDKQKRALERLFRELVVDDEEQARLRKELGEGKKKAEAMRRAFAARRAGAREAFRGVKGVAAGDLEILDTLLDQLDRGLLEGIEA